MHSVFVYQELCSYPCLYAEGVSSKSVIAGHMSSNWIVSALSVLATVGELYCKVSKYTYYCTFNIELINGLYSWLFSYFTYFFVKDMVLCPFLHPH
jgi:hypothetical protein